MTKIFLFDLILNGNRTDLFKQREINCPDRCETYEQMVGILNRNLNLNKCAREKLYVFAINNNLNPIGLYEVSSGSNIGSMICTRELFSFLLMVGAEQFVLFHNHPSGNITPSNNDLITTKRVVEASKLLGITFLEHIIVARKKWKIIDKSLYSNSIPVPLPTTGEMDIPEISLEGI